MPARIVSVSRSGVHEFSKTAERSVRIVAGLGVDGDAHSGVTVKHRSRVARNPNQPNLRQVHLMHAELFDEVKRGGFDVKAGDLGENITTQGLDLLGLPTGTRLRLGATALVEITGLRNPCPQIDRFQEGLTEAVLDRDENGKLIRKAGVMAIALADGDVAPGDGIEVILPPPPHKALEPV